MASFMKASDAITAAVEIERRGYDFYTQLAQQVSGEDQVLFQLLANEEKAHESLFTAMLQRVGAADIPLSSSDEEYLSYLHGLLDAHCLFTADLAQRAKEKPASMAVQLEKDTLLFFTEMAEAVPASEKALVLECAAEERKHIRRLLLYFAKK